LIQKVLDAFQGDKFTTGGEKGDAAPGNGGLLGFCGLSRQATAGEGGNNLSSGPPLALGKLFSGLENVVIDIECGSHVSDVNASMHQNKG
jgi:hypothetical protein